MNRRDVVVPPDRDRVHAGGERAGELRFGAGSGSGGLQRLRSSTVATLSLTEPLTAALLGVVVLDERPGLLALLGALVLLSGLLVISTRPASIDEPLPEP